MVRDYHGDRPPSRRGRKSFGTVPSASASSSSRFYAPLETRENSGGSGSGGTNSGMDEYESLKFGNDSPAATSHQRRPETKIQIPQLKSSSSSMSSFRRKDRESVLVPLRGTATAENPLAQAKRLQSAGSTITSSNSTRFLQAGLGSTMDQVHKATEPYAARKNRAKHSRAALSTSRDVLGTALLESRKPSPKPGPHNTVDLCDPGDEDEDHASPNPAPTNSSSLASPRERLDRHDHSDNDDIAKETPGYIQTLQHTIRNATRDRQKHQQGPATPKQPTIRPADSSSTNSHPISGSPRAPQSHSPTLSHPADDRPRSSSPKLSQADAPSDHSSDHSSNTPSPSQSPSTRWGWRRASTSTHDSEDLEVQHDTDGKSQKHQHQHPQTKRPKVDFSNVPQSRSKVTEVEEAPSHSPKSNSSISRTTQFVVDGLSSSEEESEPPPKKQTIIKDVWDSVVNMISPKSRSKSKQKKQDPKITITSSEGTPTDQLPEDLRTVIKATRNKSPRDDSSFNDDHQKDDSTKLRRMAEALEVDDDDDWSKPTTSQSKATATANFGNSTKKRPRIASHDSDREREPSLQPSTVSKFRLSKANNKGTINNTSIVRRNNPYGNSKHKATKINPGCTFHVSSNAPFPWREESPSEFQATHATPSIQTRSSTRLKRKRHQEVVEIDDSDSEIEEVTISQEPMMEMELIRIAIGKKVATAECMARFDPNTSELHLAWKNTKRARTRSDDRGGRDSRTISLRDAALEQFVVYTANDEIVSTVSSTHDYDHLNSFVAMRIAPTEDNLLNRYSKSYIPNHDDPKYRYIILEFRDAAIFSTFVNRSEGKLSRTVELLHVPRECCADYASSLLANNHEEKKWRQRNVFVAGRALDYKLLVFPFVGDPSEIESAAEGLTEAARSALPGDFSTMMLQQQPAKFMETTTDSDNNEDDDTKPRHRAHFVTITVEDYDRLDPGEWLNDSLVDFWMQWISRDDTTLDSKFHFFTSHFFSRLSEDGPEAVASWTRRKNINIFEKKFIFIPINKSMHWSLCLVVNPGAIVEGGDRERTKDDPLSCMIFMDSLRMHNKKNIAETIRNWLNSEWKRMYKDILLDKSARTGDGPFNSDNFKIFSPRVPLQNNTYDCGVFVCRYAHAVYELRHRNFTYGDAGMYCTDDDDEGRRGATSKAFQELISDSAEFDFNMGDIARFREEFKILLEKLSTIYLKMKNADILLEQQQKTTTT